MPPRVRAAVQYEHAVKKWNLSDVNETMCEIAMKELRTDNKIKLFIGVLIIVAVGLIVGFSI